MKRSILLIITSLFLLNQLKAQEITITPIFTLGSYHKFQNNFGYAVGYNQLIKPNSRLGFTFSHSFNNTDYNYTFISDADGINYYREVKANNQRLTFSVNYSFNILKSQKSKLFIGPKSGINYFKIEENGTEKPSNENTTNEYYRNYWRTSKIGTGLLLEYERRIFSDNISVFVSVEPEVIFFSQFGLMDSSDPTMIGFVNFNLGIKFSKQ
jgi:hypothetical protein